MQTITMRQLFEADMEAVESDYQALMKAEAEQFTAVEEAHEKKMTLLAEQRDIAKNRHKARYGFTDAEVVSDKAEASEKQFFGSAINHELNVGQ